jgi:hypothetical protein
LIHHAGRANTDRRAGFARAAVPSLFPLRTLSDPRSTAREWRRGARTVATMAQPPDRRNWPKSRAALQSVPEHRKILLEYEQVRVLEACVAPGGTVAVHSRRGSDVFRVLGSSDLVGREPSGTVVWRAPLAPHSLTNVGTLGLRVLAVEIKR